MDKKIEKKKRPLWQWGLIGIVVAGSGWYVYQLLADASIRTYRVPQEQLIVSTVEFGAFEDLIPIRGTIQPFNSVFLDAVVGGAVEEIFVEEGSFVEAGQALVQLSNSQTRLSAAQTGSIITEQLNNLSNITDGFDADKLRTDRSIIEVEYRIKTLERQKAQFENLASRDLISDEERQLVLDELEYMKKVLVNTIAVQDLQEKIREERLEQIAEQREILQENYEISQSSYENLLVKAPITGQLTSLDVEIGESKSTGQRLGQIDVVDQYKIVAQIDEYYVSRVVPDQAAGFTRAGTEFDATVIRV